MKLSPSADPAQRPPLRASRPRGGEPPGAFVLRPLLAVINRTISGFRQPPVPVPGTPALQGSIRCLQEKMDTGLVWHGVDPTLPEHVAREALTRWAEARKDAMLSSGQMAAHLSTIENAYSKRTVALDEACQHRADHRDTNENLQPDARRKAAGDVTRAVAVVRSELTDLQRANPALR